MRVPHLTSGLGFSPTLLATLLCAAAFANGQDRLADSRAALEHFEKRVRPLLVERCYKCHAGEKLKGGLRLDSADGLRRGGESGAVFVVGKPEESRLIQAVLSENSLKMPPDGK